MANPRICSIEGCDNPLYGRGWCSLHWQRWRKTGDPLGILKKYPGTDFLNEKALSIESDECLNWPFSVNGLGYGKCRWNGKRQYVHRIICEETYGPAPTHVHQAAHECGNPRCVNPRHIKWKTPIKNIADQIRHQTRCAPEECRHKLTEEQVREIRALHGKASIPVIAARFGVSLTMISRINSGKNWGWLTD